MAYNAFSFIIKAVANEWDSITPEERPRFFVWPQGGVLLPAEGVGAETGFAEHAGHNLLSCEGRKKFFIELLHFRQFCVNYELPELKNFAVSTAHATAAKAAEHASQASSVTTETDNSVM